MAIAITVSKQGARRFVLGKQGLWPGRRWTGIDGTAAAMRAVEYLQLDPLQIVARSHDLMLHARVAGYRPAFFNQVTYEQRGFFDWGGWLAVRPMDELPYWRTIMVREKDHEGTRKAIAQHGAAFEAMRAALEERETVSAKEMASNGRIIVKDYRGGRDSSLALYYLWRTGEAMTHHRDGFERIYARSELVAPSHLLAPATELDADLFVARKSVAFHGIGGLSGGGLAPFRRQVARSVDTRGIREIEDELVARGALARVQVEGSRGGAFVLADDLDLLAEVEAGRVPAAWTPIETSTEDEVAFLSPLDPVSARGRAKALFDFDYLWEIYMREDLVVYGRFTMPILWGDALVGRIDLRMDRKAGTLVVNGLWFEEKVTARDAAFVDALAAGVARLVTFLGARRVDAASVTNRSLRARLVRAGKQAGR